MRKKLKTVRATYTGLPDSALERRMKVAAGRWPEFTAYGFRRNDRLVSWDCKSESAAKALRAKLRKIKHDSLAVELE